MSEVMQLGDSNEVSYVLDEFGATEQLGDQVLLEDGTRAVLVNGNLLTVNGETLILQDDGTLSQYCLDETPGPILIPKHETQTLLSTQNDSGSAQQILYIQGDEVSVQESVLQNQFINLDEQNGQVPLNVVNLDNENAGEVMYLGEFLRQHGLVESNNSNCQYTIIGGDGNNLQVKQEIITSFPKKVSHRATVKSQKCGPPNHAVDISKIQGRNLLTGQPIMLSHYMDKIQSKMDDIMDKSTNQKKDNNPPFSELLRKTIKIGRARNGKSFVVKILDVRKPEKKPVSSNKRPIINQSEIVKAIESDHGSLVATNKCRTTNDDRDPALDLAKRTVQFVPTNAVLKTNTPDNVSELNIIKLEKEEPVGNTALDPRTVFVHERLVTKECFEHISKVLAGLMKMDSVTRKLQNRNIIVKVVEKSYDPAIDSHRVKVSFSSGYMVQEYRLNENQDEMIETWKFMPDVNTKDIIFGNCVEEIEENGNSDEMYTLTASVTVTITQDKSGDKHTKVMLDPCHNPKGYKCRVCQLSFKTSVLLKIHMNGHSQTKLAFNAPKTECNEIEVSIDPKETENNERMYECVECSKCFPTTVKLCKHMNLHFKPIECPYCDKRFPSLNALKKHIPAHKDNFLVNPELEKGYTCGVCNRTFSRQSNLQRHLEIHKGAGSRYKCSVCGCSYHFMSSLTRHMVQNHMDFSQHLSDFSSQSAKEEPIIDDSSKPTKLIHVNGTESVTMVDMSDILQD